MNRTLDAITFHTFELTATLGCLLNPEGSDFGVRSSHWDPNESLQFVHVDTGEIPEERK